MAVVSETIYAFIRFSNIKWWIVYCVVFTHIVVGNNANSLTSEITSLIFLKVTFYIHSIACLLLPATQNRR